ncbi:hypothetical protein PCASD_26852 [Puccinia coronata f. sp. avenae]|uniref:Uncharacterized protein n=1 Tax=Puccinia coronata f. sp. avenae TaxID=200324 RepID=A0A2N5RTQ6_9BASI|nr:hypothetical protein PCASD_26852 [Puccinia coronata f. sp. avenae]
MVLRAGGRHHKVNLFRDLIEAQPVQLVRLIVSKHPVFSPFWYSAGIPRDAMCYPLGRAGRAGRFEPYSCSRQNYPGSNIYNPGPLPDNNPFVCLHILVPRATSTDTVPDPVLDGVAIPDPVRALAAIT